MKLTAATMIISRVCVYHFERFVRALKNVSDEIRLYSVVKTTSMVNPRAIEERAGECRIQFIVCNEIASIHNVKV